jgi:hypothetical protein
MLRLNTFRKFLSQQKISNGSRHIDSDLQGVLGERVRIRQEIAKKHK